MSKKSIAIAIILLFSLVSFADNRSESDSVAVATVSEGKMNIPEFILEHIGDSYYWHIVTYKGHEISTPFRVLHAALKLRIVLQFLAATQAVQ